MSRFMGIPLAQLAQQKETEQLQRQILEQQQQIEMLLLQSLEMGEDDQ